MIIPFQARISLHPFLASFDEFVVAALIIETGSRSDVYFNREGVQFLSSLDFCLCFGHSALEDQKVRVPPVRGGIAWIDLDSKSGLDFRPQPIPRGGETIHSQSVVRRAQAVVQLE